MEVHIMLISILCKHTAKTLKREVVYSNLDRTILFFIIGLIIMLFFTECHKQRSSYWYYDKYRLVLIFNVEDTLEEFILLRSYDKTIAETPLVANDSVAIPKLGTMGIEFNLSEDTIINILGIPNYRNSFQTDSLKYTILGYSMEDSSSITFTLVNDSLSRISSNIKWLILPQNIKVGVTADIVSQSFGEADFIGTQGLPSLGREIKLDR